MTPIKLNMVVMRGINDDEIEEMVDFVIARNIDIRFIETMPIGAAGIDAVGHHYSESDILKRMHTHLHNRLLATHSKQTALISLSLIFVLIASRREIEFS
jgi:cyclic pyranopterin phosphate synthase